MLAGPEVDPSRPPRPRPVFGFELVLVVLVALAVLVPGIWNYSLVDPWETHYGEVARNMIHDQDFVHTQWPGSNESASPNEGFRSKPVLQFWMMSAGLAAMDVGDYSGSMVHDEARTAIAIRLPFILSAAAGLTLMWWMLATLISRRLAWLALLVVGTSPMFCLIARQGIPDMPHCACVIGALSLFALATEDGDRDASTRARRAIMVLLALAIVGQGAYYAFYFFTQPRLAVNGVPNPAIVLPVAMTFAFAILSHDGWQLARLPLLLIGGIIAAIRRTRVPARQPGQSTWRVVIDNWLGTWDYWAPDRIALRELFGDDAALRVLHVARVTTMRQIYLLACYFLLGVSILAKGPPGLTVVGIVGVGYVVILGKWRDLARGGFELKRGIVVILAVCVPWHVAMFWKDGIGFVTEYIYQQILSRASVGIDNSPGTFEHYTAELGVGMWLWAALVPAALSAALLRARIDTREGRVRFIIGLWAIAAVTLFSIVQTKFHHYILPAVPALAILVAAMLDDILAGRTRLHPVFAAIGVGIVLLVCRDLVYEPKRWIEMFVFRYDRPWPSGEPWSADPGTGFMALGIAGALAICLLATRFVRLGVTAVCAVGVAICIWALQAYMPIAGTHWGMGEAARTYYRERTIYGEKIVYFARSQIRADWDGRGNDWAFDTFIPDNLQIGQPMTITLQLNKTDDDKTTGDQLALIGTVSAIGDHRVTVALPMTERAKVTQFSAGKDANLPPRAPIYAVDADRLVAWQLYWRGEQFWSGGEIWAWLPDMKTTFQNTNNVDFQKYIGDRTRSPFGRRYFFISEAGHMSGLKGLLPAGHPRETFEVIDTTSNKFSLASAYF